MNIQFLLLTVCLMLAIPTHSQSQESTNVSIATAEASATSNQTSTSKKSVTVTSDGKNTIKRISTTINGVEKVIIETTDENGKTTTTEEHPDEAKSAASDSAWIGIRVKEVSKIMRNQLNLAKGEGLRVELVAAGGPAAKAGISEVDLLLSFGGQSVSTTAELTAQLGRHKAGDKVELSIMRKGKRGTINVLLEQRPSAKKGALPPGIAEGFKNETGEVSVSVDGADVGKAFDSVLDDPKIPESFKETVRKMRQRLQDFEKRNSKK